LGDAVPLNSINVTENKPAGTNLTRLKGKNRDANSVITCSFSVPQTVLYLDTSKSNIIYFNV